MLDLGLIWGYWGRGMPDNLVELSVEAEKLGFDAVWSAESWGSDAFSPLVLIAAHTERLSLGPGVTDPYTRHPAITAATSTAVIIIFIIFISRPPASF